MTDIFTSGHCRFPYSHITSVTSCFIRYDNCKKTQQLIPVRISAQEGQRTLKSLLGASCVKQMLSWDHIDEVGSALILTYDRKGYACQNTAVTVKAVPSASGILRGWLLRLTREEKSRDFPSSIFTIVCTIVWNHCDSTLLGEFNFLQMSFTLDRFQFIETFFI